VGATGGTYKLWLQELYPTTDLTFSSSTSSIASALVVAAQQLSALSVTVECSSFTVTKLLLDGGNSLQLNITFRTDSVTTPLSHTTAYIDELTGTKLLLPFKCISVAAFVRLYFRHSVSHVHVLPTFMCVVFHCFILPLLFHPVVF
jgi:hypothetical protein